MNKINYEEAIKIFGDHNKFDKKFIMLKNNECDLYKIDDNSYFIVFNNIKYNKNEVKFSSYKIIDDDLLMKIKDEIGSYIFKVYDEDKIPITVGNIIDIVYNAENQYQYDIEDVNEYYVYKINVYEI